MLPRDDLRAIVVIAVLLLIFAVIATAVSVDATAGFDRAVLLSLREAANRGRPSGPEWLVEAARDFTSLGSVIVVLLFTGTVAGYWLLTEKRRSGTLLVASVVGALLLNDLLKLIFDRARPDAILQSARVFTAGFPSGHAALSFAAYFSAAALISREQHHASRTFLIGVAAGVVALIGFSRLYLGLHYPTDIAAGWCVGAIWLLFCRWLLGRV